MEHQQAPVPVRRRWPQSFSRCSQRRQSIETFKWRAFLNSMFEASTRPHTLQALSENVKRSRAAAERMLVHERRSQFRQLACHLLWSMRRSARRCILDESEFTDAMGQVHHILMLNVSTFVDEHVVARDSRSFNMLCFSPISDPPVFTFQPRQIDLDVIGYSGSQNNVLVPKPFLAANVDTDHLPLRDSELY